LLGDLDKALETGLQAQFRAWRDGSREVDRQFLATFGRFPEDGDETIVRTPVLERFVLDVDRALRSERPRSALVVGESGVGKTSGLAILFTVLRRNGWTVFEASGAQVIAGQKYVGELEERVGRILTTVRGERRFVWNIPTFGELLEFGRHRHSETSVLDLLLPAIAAGELLVVGELRPAELERLGQMRPGFARLFEVVRLEALDERETPDFGRRWLDRRPQSSRVPADEHVLRETASLARQYLGERASPGALVDLLERTCERRESTGDTESPLSVADLYTTLGRVTGLPVSILDDREPLDVDDVRRFFELRVMGQVEAVECLVERIAMIKAGLTDPTRPQGVFLFTGPTGTGKTEIAKALAEFLFGSADRMIRLDMSEFQAWESFARILGDPDPRADQSALVHRIREQPFSVMLLDEFDKAHPRVWDLFLQVFDDGRLTDGRGRVADCRYTIIILTANVASGPSDGAGIGFKPADGEGGGAVERALSAVFRREFLNRLDRVVRFRPLGRSVMRDLLAKELAAVLERRGLRQRQWAVEWDESALEFLLEKGFSQTLGARPLRRAVERYLLSPLATTIVSHRFPEGDQFLFVRSDGRRIDVEFVDPDAPDAPSAEAVPHATDTDAAAKLSLETLVLGARGVPDEVGHLGAIYGELEETIESTAWKERGQEMLAMMSSAGFWSAKSRFAVLGEVEYRDRIAAGLRTAGSLLGRLVGSDPRGRERYPATLVGRLAEQLYLVRAAVETIDADEPYDAFLVVAGTRDSLADPVAADRFAERVATMYRKWARRRRMTFDVLEERAGGDEPYRLVVAVSGYGAYRLLAREAGLHVLESPTEGSSGQPRAVPASRSRVRVTVAPQPDEPLPRKPRARVARALEALSEFGETTEVVRRYREGTSPLVRDSVRGWRTGRFAQVLGGDFDLMR